jgi:glycosyltransferase involved in cell wall biosynthesis
VSSALLAKGVEQHRLLSFTNRVDVELFGARAGPKVRCPRLQIPPGGGGRCYARTYLETLCIAGDVADCTEYQARHVANFKPTPVCPNQRLADLRALYPAGKYRILHVGRKEAQKNGDTVIRALAHLGPDYSLVMLGPGKEEWLWKVGQQTRRYSRTRGWKFDN